MKQDRQDDVNMPLGWRVAFTPFIVIGALESLLRSHRPRGKAGFLRFLSAPAIALLDGYERSRTWALAHPWYIAASLCIAAILLCLLTLLARAFYVWFHNYFLAWLMGTRVDSAPKQPKVLAFSLIEQFSRVSPSDYFVGLNSEHEAVTISENDLCEHMHILGPTGTGKTESVIFPLLAQDMARGKGLVFIDAKGALEAILRFKGLASLVHRQVDVRVFSLPFAGQAHSYNPVFLGPNDDPTSVAERVFCDFPLENAYYRGQAKQMFYSLIRAFAATGKPFSLIDVRVALVDDAALAYALEQSDDMRAKYDIANQLGQLGKKRHETFTGLFNALCDFDPGGELSEALNSYAPDIVLEDAVNRRQLVYFHLPANAYPLLAPAVGKIALRQLAGVGSARECYPQRYDAKPFSVSIDECHQFVFESLLNSLTMLRSSKMQFRLANQTSAQFEKVDASFEAIIRTNCRSKIIFYCEDPAQIETICRSLGTKTVFKKTVRFQPGFLWTHKNTHEASNREVQEFIVHPDALKNLAARGQAYVIRQSKAVAVSLAMLPKLKGDDFPLQRKPRAEGLDLKRHFIDAKMPNRPGTKKTGNGLS